ncbi:MAG: hypothetical protein AAGC93_13425 [Cyanobacteria bacterium P01_F01_bin.53]
MKLTRLLAITRLVAGLPALGLLGVSLVMAPSSLAESFPENQKAVKFTAVKVAAVKGSAVKLSPLSERSLSERLASRLFLTQSSVTLFTHPRIQYTAIPASTHSDSGRRPPRRPPSASHAAPTPQQLSVNSRELNGRENSPLPQPPLQPNQRPAIHPPRNSRTNADGSVRISHRLPIDASGSMLEVRAQSEAFQPLQLFDNDAEKDSFSLALRHPVMRAPQSEFSLSWGFAYHDESLPPRPSLPALAPTEIITSSGGAAPSVAPPPPSERLPQNLPTNRPPNSPPAPPSLVRAASTPTRTSLAVAPNSPTTNSPTTSLPTAEPSNSAQPLGQPPNAPSNTAMRTGEVQFSQNYRQRDRGGQWLARSQFNLGTELTDSPSPMGADSQFFSWLGRLERTQAISHDQQLTLQLDTQLSPNNLLPPHQFKMKDRRFNSFEREARPTEISGNNGIRFRLEDRMIVLSDRTSNASIVSLIPFVDLGYAWGQGNRQRPNQQFLGRTGLGLLVEPLTGLDIQVDYLTYWGDLSAEAQTQDVYVMFGYQNEW